MFEPGNAILPEILANFLLFFVDEGILKLINNCQICISRMRLLQPRHALSPLLQNRVWKLNFVPHRDPYILGHIWWRHNLINFLFNPALICLISFIFVFTIVLEHVIPKLFVIIRFNFFSSVLNSLFCFLVNIVVVHLKQYLVLFFLWFLLVYINIMLFSVFGNDILYLVKEVIKRIIRIVTTWLLTEHFRAFIFWILIFVHHTGLFSFQFYLLFEFCVSFIYPDVFQNGLFVVVKLEIWLLLKLVLFMLCLFYKAWLTIKEVLRLNWRYRRIKIFRNFLWILWWRRWLISRLNCIIISIYAWKSWGVWSCK